ncbi:MAG: hybrid sensor histidine kinase/response regulator [Myxococcaceae bacterium]
MASSDMNEVLSALPQAVVRVDARLRVLWVESRFGAKTGLRLVEGSNLMGVLEATPERDALEKAIASRERFSGELVTSTLKQSKVQTLQVQESTGAAWVFFEPSGLDDDAGFARALQEIARSLGESLDADALCASAVVAMVRCAQVSRAEVYLVDPGGELCQVARSDANRTHGPGAVDTLAAASVKHVLATGQPEIGVMRGSAAWEGAMFAAVPVSAQRRIVGLLVIYKGLGASFSVRELDLWSAAAGQLAVALENARLLVEAQAALQIREEFMTIASHELKTPLTPLKMNLSMMERRLEQGQPVELAAILKTKRQVDRLASLVGDLLDASRLELGKLVFARQPVELAQLAVEVVEEFKVAFDREFQLTLPGEPLWVWGDRTRLEQVLVNLIDNAHKYSPDGPPVRVRLERIGQDACLEVLDRGIGIPQLDQAQIFQRFYRARNASNRNFGGLGLGLFISHSIVRLHGGGLTLESEEGRGARFTVRLPRMSASEVAELPRKVLLVDEDRPHVMAVEAMLRAEHFEVVSASSGGDALRALSRAPVSAVVVSCTLPEGRLLTTTATALPRVRPVPFVFCGDELPSWSGPGSLLCQRDCAQPELAAALREALWRGAQGERAAG